MTIKQSIAPLLVTFCLGYLGTNQTLSIAANYPLETDRPSYGNGRSDQGKTQKKLSGYEAIEFIAQSPLSSELFNDSQISPEQIDLEEGIFPELPIRQDLEDQDTEELEQDFKEAASESENLDRRKELIRRFMLRSLAISSQRYPFLIDPTDNVTFEPLQFNPFELENYGQFDLQINNSDFVIDKITYGLFPKENQFYWVLPNNRIVFETQGWVGGLRYQGQTTDIREIRDARQEVSFWGLQAVWNIPRIRTNGSDVVDILPIEELRQADITTFAGQVTSNDGFPGQVIINSGIDLNDPNIIDISELLNSPPGLGETSTNSTQGGKNLFEGLEDERTPIILQAFPTSDLSKLLENNVDLREGEFIPRENLTNTGIVFGDVIKGDRIEIDLDFTSVPGVKFARPFDDFKNLDLLNVLVNPDLTGKEYDRRYLNSLLWNGIRRSPRIDNARVTTETTSWYQGYLSRPHKRAAITYHAEEPSATFTEIFANPGLGFTVGSWGDKFDGIQSLNITTGLLLGGIFEAVDEDGVQDSLNTAKELFEQGKLTSGLNTKATPQELRELGLRLDKSLLYADFNTNIAQTSGRLTSDSYVTPKTSELWQLRTGLFPRRVQVIEEQQLSSTAGQPFFSKVDISQFGQLTFIGVPTSEDRLFETPEETNSTPASSFLSLGTPRTTFGTEVLLTTPNGQRFLQRFSTDSTQFSSLPNAIKSFDIAFDRVNIAQIDQIQSLTSIYEGIAYVPAIELAYAGSSDLWYYNLNAGVWATFNSQVAPGVTEKVIDNNEPTIGAYLKGFANAIQETPILSGNSMAMGVKAYGPTFRFNADTQSRFNLTLGYEYGERRPGLGWTLRPTLFYSQGTSVDEEESLQNWVGLLDGQIGWQSGLSIINRLEVGEQLFASLTARQRLNPNISIGIYTQNFDNEISGLGQRIEGNSTGLILRYDSTRSRTSFYEGRIGTSDAGLDFEFRSRFVF
ncbi:hypothetical protein AWQ21_10130 [Picosynechococcus sp. PCC 7003]|uniref:hypothetical protein n=1 Tax=Picosynechococcus sp. PCC 7003 TaxID=374981 RepID=UPI000810791F|nr:hypothetical protein [Picosynechococcus sp. PCC 7003]ANV84709.1 hypothetical protein AWQ21_10130 [Picosynechococcus sp. PCC 7003]